MFKFVILATILASVSAGLIAAPLVVAPAGPLLAAAPAGPLLAARTPVVAPVIAKTLVATHGPIVAHTPVHVVHPAPIVAGPAIVKAPLTVIH